MEKTKVKVIIIDGVVDDILTNGDVEVEVVNIDKDYTDYDKLCEYSRKLHSDPSLKSADYTTANFENE